MLGLRPGQRVNQIVEGTRLVLELRSGTGIGIDGHRRPGEPRIVDGEHDADALAGSLGKGKRAHAVDEIKAAGRTAMAKAGAAGLEKGR